MKALIEFDIDTEDDFKQLFESSAIEGETWILVKDSKNIEIAEK